MVEIEVLRWKLLSLLTSVSGAQRLYTIASALLALSWLASMLTVWVRNPRDASSNQQRTWKYVSGTPLFLGLGALTILCYRVPGWLPSQLNPDEGQFIAAAQKLLIDPVFWRSVDTYSSGPLNIYPLMLPAAFGLAPDYAGARIVGVLMLTASVLLMHLGLGVAFGERAARLSTFITGLTLALMQFRDFASYSSELSSILLIGTAAALILRATSSPLAGLSAGLMAAGALLVLVPFAKIQGLPLAASLAMYALYRIWIICQSRHAATVASMSLLGGAGVILVLAASLISVLGLWSHFLQTYIGTNLIFYSQYSDRTTISKVRAAWQMFATTPQVWLPFVVIALLTLLNLAFTVGKRLKPDACSSRGVAASRGIGWLGFGFAWLAVAAFTVAMPGNSFEHYLLWLSLPAGLLMAALMARFEASSGYPLSAVDTLAPLPGTAIWRTALTPPGAALLVIVLCCLVPIGARYRAGSDYLNADQVNLARDQNELSALLRSMAPVGSRMAIWGWAAELHVQTGFIQASRYGITVWQIEENPRRDEFIAEFLRDLEESKPALFVDAMSLQLFYFVGERYDRTLRQHDNVPAIANWVNDNYKLAAQWRDVRIYLRNDIAIH